jgi:hypothetical protein
MKREKIGRIVHIGNGLCRVIVKSERLAKELARYPDVELRAEDPKHLGWWLIFPERLLPVMKPAFKKTGIIITRRPEQLSLLNGMTENEPADEGVSGDDDPETEGTVHGEDPAG